MTAPAIRAPRPALAALLAGDLVVFIIFAMMGVSTHNEGSALTTIARAGAPFAISWFLIGGLLGVFRQSLWTDARRSLWYIPLVWLACDAVALVGRSLWLGNPIILSFALVTFGAVALLLTAWRISFALAVQRISAMRR